MKKEKMIMKSIESVLSNPKSDLTHTSDFSELVQKITVSTIKNEFPFLAELVKTIFDVLNNSECNLEPNNYKKEINLFNIWFKTDGVKPIKR